VPVPSKQPTRLALVQSDVPDTPLAAAPPAAQLFTLDGAERNLVFAVLNAARVLRTAVGGSAAGAAGAAGYIQQLVRAVDALDEHGLGCKASKPTAETRETQPSAPVQDPAMSVARRTGKTSGY